MAATADSQLDMLTLLQATATPRCLYRSPARGLPARAAEFEAWQQEFGNFGSGFRAHAWTLAITHPGSPAGRCQPTVLSADLRVPYEGFTGAMPDCDCTTRNAVAYRGACRGCRWEGPQVTSENLAVEDACGHAHPGWWDLPAVPRRPEGDDPRTKNGAKARARWIAQVNAVYPPGWLEAGGPIRTLRPGGGLRHHCPGTPFGGYDLSVPAVTG